MSKRFVLTVVACVVLGLLAGCGGNATDPVPAPPSATPAPTATATVVAVTLDEVIWSTASDPSTGAPVDPLTTLPNSAPQVIASVHADLLPAGSELQAHWSIDGEPLPALEPQPVVIEADRTDAWVSWSLAWTGEQPWPIGTLGIEIDVNGEVKAQSEILITRDHSVDGPG